MPRNQGRNIGVLDEPIVHALVQAVTPAPLSSAQRASMKERIMSRVGGLQPPLTETIRTASIPWRDISPGVRAKLLKRDESADLIIVLWQLDPGGRLAGHHHTSAEECLVLEGEMLVGAHRVQAGELHIGQPGSIHDDLTTQTGCLVVVRSGISPLLADLFAT